MGVMSLAKTVRVVLAFGLMVGCAASEGDGNPGAAAIVRAGAGGSASGSGGVAGGSATGRGGDTGSGVAGNGPGGSSAGTTGAAGAAAGASGAAGADGMAGLGGSAAGSTGAAGAGVRRAGRGGARRAAAVAAWPAAAPAGSTAPVARAAVPSAGCGKSGRPSGGRVMVTNDHIYDFPTSYDGTKPFPLLIGFHAAGNPIDQIEGLTNGSAFETNYVRAFPKSAGNEWVYNTDLASKAYKTYDDLMANYCIDKSRVFATGHSSGAQMIVQILVHCRRRHAHGVQGGRAGRRVELRRHRQPHPRHVHPGEDGQRA